jgi:hypothetical protein
MSIDLNKPIVWTTKGNVNSEAITKTYPVWTETDDYIEVKFVYEIEGEVVREDKYVKFKQGMSLAGVQGG